MARIKSAARAEKASILTGHGHREWLLRRPGCHWFAEAALFAEAVTHNCSLKRLALGDN